MSENTNNPELFTPNSPVVTIEDEMRDSYLEYAMSVIVGRALPDVRDGLKPVHRRVLYAMDMLGNNYNKAYKKSARIVGDVIGKYHPHGDTAVYDTIVRMAQPFSMRNILIDGQGNFGSVDGDSAAAMRYTEIRMSKLSHELLRDLDKKTVDFIDNYDGSETEPSVLPTRIPNLLVNGSSGIAVGMATNIPPHNLVEVINACLTIIDKDSITLDELLAVIPGPDFPTAGIVNGASGIRQAYETGKGKIYLRAVSHIENTDKQSIVVTELPYQVNKAKLITKIAQLVKDKKINGITGLRDESDKDGMRMVIELKRAEVPEVMLNNLYKLTDMQTVFGINMVAIDKGMPKLMSLREILDAFIAHRRDVVTRRSIFELNKARNRAHILEGLSVALSNIDRIIELIKAASSPAVAKAQLLAQAWQASIIQKDLIGTRDMSLFKPEYLPAGLGLQKSGDYWFSQKQAQAILDLKLHRLTGLEKDKIFDEFNELLEFIKYLLDILQDCDKLMQVIRDELIKVRDDFANKRLTEIIESKIDLTLEDLIIQEERVVTLSHGGYIKAQSLSDYQAQRRGGKGKLATKMKDEDFVDKLFVANSHDMVLCFSSIGKVYWLKVYELPMASRISRGKPIINLLSLAKNESINAVLPVSTFSDNQFVFMATSSGICKKTALTDFSRPRKGGIIAIALRNNDKLVGVDITSGANDIMLFSAGGKSIRFKESDVRVLGRSAIGVRGMSLKDDKIVSVIIVNSKDPILTATEFGYGKRTNIDEYRTQARGGSGSISIKTSDRNGKVVGAIQVSNEDEMMLISNKATLVRARVSDVSIIGRNTQGVTLIKIAESEKLVSVAKIVETKY